MWLADKRASTITHRYLFLSESVALEERLAQLAIIPELVCIRFCLQETKYICVKRRPRFFALNAELLAATAGESSRVHEGMLVGVKQMDKDTGIMPWESLQVEWDDETDANTVNPWEVEAASAAMVAARHHLPGGS